MCVELNCQPLKPSYHLSDVLTPNMIKMWQRDNQGLETRRLQSSGVRRPSRRPTSVSSEKFILEVFIHASSC